MVHVIARPIDGPSEVVIFVVVPSGWLFEANESTCHMVAARARFERNVRCVHVRRIKGYSHPAYGSYGRDAGGIKLRKEKLGPSIVL